MKNPLESIKKIFQRKMTLDEVHKYWKNPPKINLPDTYYNSRQGLKRSYFLENLISNHTDLTKNSSILEIGCNVGRNLNLLNEKGFSNLQGIEINSDAIKKMKEYFPDLKASIINGSAENTIKKIPDQSFDLVYTMAVLVHIHPESEWVFSEIVRITKKYLITIEYERSTASFHFKRNYQKVFENLGLKQIFVVECSKINSLGGKYFARIFEK